MAFAWVLRKGFEQLWREGESEFRSRFVDHPGHEAHLEIVQRAVLGVGDQLVAIDGVTCDENAPLFARALAPALMTYLLRDEDLLPSREGQLILGVLDDSYLVNRGVLALANYVQNVDLRAVEENLASLRALLPDGIADELDAMVERVFSDVEQQLQALRDGGTSG